MTMADPTISTSTATTLTKPATIPKAKPMRRLTSKRKQKAPR
jgi:hypothetical protein